MVDYLYSKGAQFVGSVIGGTLAGLHFFPLSNKFWHYSCKGDIRTGTWMLCSLPNALKIATEEVFYHGIPIEELIEEGQKIPYLPYSKGGGYLAPARGGKSDDALKAMGPNP